MLASLGAMTGPALGQQATVTIDATSGYEDSLICYQFHGVTMQIARAMGGRATISDNQKEQYAKVAQRSEYMQQKWFQRLGDVNGDKKAAEMNADLQRVAGGIVADANAGLGGDQEALARADAVRNKCSGFEHVEVAAPAAPATPPPG